MSINSGGKLYTIAAPSGVGKTSLVAALVAEIDNLQVSVSYTTRAKRPKEIDGVNYNFVDEATFAQMIQQNDFLEYATVFGNNYGTSKTWVVQQLKMNKNIILEIDWQGVVQVKRLFPECVRIFILPPSMEALKERLQARGQDSQAVIDERLAAAKAELSHYQASDFLVINDDFATALADLKAIVQSDKRKQADNSANARALAQRLLDFK